jgi:hypothetical protein
MNMNKMKLQIGALMMLALLPNTSLAYFTTAQSATRITTDTILYTVSYKFGFTSRELYMPIIAKRGVEAPTTSPLAGYQIMNDDETVVTTGLSNSIVLTRSKDVKIKNNQYYLPKGKAAEFTLVTLLTIPSEQQTNDLNLSLLVTNLPFTMVQDGASIPTHLNPSELQYYRTPAISFDENSLTVSSAKHTLSTKH